MFSRQNIWFQMALIIVTFLLLWFLGSGRVEASDDVYIGENTATYNGYTFTYVKANYLSYKDINNATWKVIFSEEVYLVYFYSNTRQYGHLLAYSDKEFSCLGSRDGSVVSSIYLPPQETIVSNNKTIYRREIGGSVFTNVSIPLNECVNSYAMRDVFQSYLTSGFFEDVKAPIKAIWAQGLADSYYSLRFVQGMVEDNIFRAFWGFPARSDLESYENLPLRVKFNVTDTDTESVTSFFYPTYLEGFKPTKAQYSVKDYQLSIPLDLLGDHLPTNYRINYVELYPYYFVNDEVSQDNLRSGVKSVIRLNYDGTFNNTVEVQPDDSYSEEDADTSILGMLSNFFTNFPQMMKSLFVPEAEDIEKLLVDMNDWFSERFGFIWYPFDLAIQVVSAFTMGEADSVIEIPAVTLNMLGGVKLWDSFSVDFDSMGIFEYVRFFTSTILACSIADLAIVKWREWIGGKNG